MRGASALGWGCEGVAPAPLPLATSLTLAARGAATVDVRRWGDAAVRERSGRAARVRWKAHRRDPVGSRRGLAEPVLRAARCAHGPR